MKVNYGENRSWVSAHLGKWKFLAGGKSESDVLEAHKKGVADGDIQDKIPLFGGLGTIGYSVSETPHWLVKGLEIFNKVVGTIMPALVGWEFCKAAVNSLAEASNQGDVGMGALFGIIGIAAISIGPVVGYQTGEAYRTVYDWMKDEKMEKGFIASTLGRRR